MDFHSTSPQSPSQKPLQNSPSVIASCAVDFSDALRETTNSEGLSEPLLYLWLALPVVDLSDVLDNRFLTSYVSNLVCTPPSPTLKYLCTDGRVRELQRNLQKRIIVFTGVQSFGLFKTGMHGLIRVIDLQVSALLNSIFPILIAVYEDLVIVFVVKWWQIGFYLV